MTKYLQIHISHHIVYRLRIQIESLLSFLSSSECTKKARKIVSQRMCKVWEHLLGEAVIYQLGSKSHIIITMFCLHHLGMFFSSSLYRYFVIA